MEMRNLVSEKLIVQLVRPKGGVYSRRQLAQLIEVCPSLFAGKMK
jgi:hypothetical protein